MFTERSLNVLGMTWQLLSLEKELAEKTSEVLKMRNVQQQVPCMSIFSMPQPIRCLA
jgi:hypothetical protein